MDDPHLAEILQACYDALQAGEEPDLQVLCRSVPHLQLRAGRLLLRERRLLDACAPEREREPVADEAPVPERIGDFVLLEPLGAGGMGRVFRARQESLGREVAVKILRDEAMASASARLRFQREATITAALDHPNIVPVFATGEETGHVYLAMKLLRGRSLDRMALPLPPKEAARIGVAIAGALHAAHEVGVLHRDVKPANIVVENGVPFILDFGLARVAHGATALTQANAAPGTLVYMAPELLRRGTPVFDPRADVYGLGVTLYEVLSGAPPFLDDLSVRTLRYVLFRDPPPLRLPGRHRDLETIVLRALEKDPKRRLASAATMADELRRYLEGRPIQSRRIGPIERSWRLVRRNPLPSALLTTAMALLAALTLALWGQHDERQQRYERQAEALLTSIADSDTVTARSQLAELRREWPDAEELPDLADELEAEELLQTLLTLMQSPSMHQDPTALRHSVDALRSSGSEISRTSRARMAAALAERLLARDGPTDRIEADLAGAYPRTNAALTATSTHEDPAAALARADDDNPYDNLFAALALRLANRPLREQEAELGRAGPLESAGSAGDAIRFSHAVILETRGAYSEAEWALTELSAKPSSRVVALAGLARTGARRGRFAEAHDHLAAAYAALAERPADDLLPYVAMSELQVLLDDPDRGEEFWDRWHETTTLLDGRPWYWLLAGYAENDQAEEALADRPERAPAHFDQAKTYFERGLAHDPTPETRLTLEIAVLQLDWNRSPARNVTDPLPATVEFRDESGHLEKLAERAEELAARSVAPGNDHQIRADALLVAAQAWRASGNRQRGWQILETACREHGQPEALVTYALIVGNRANMGLDPSWSDEDANTGGGALDVAAALAIERAEAVLTRAAAGHPGAQSVAFSARLARLLCAYYVSDAAVTLPAAAELLRLEAGAPDLLGFCRSAIAEGGLSLERLWPATGIIDSKSRRRARFLLHRALATVQRGVAEGWLSADDARAILDHWQVAGALDPVREPSALAADERAEWHEFWEELRRARAALARTGR